MTFFVNEQLMDINGSTTAHVYAHTVLMSQMSVPQTIANPLMNTTQFIACMWGSGGKSGGCHVSGVGCHHGISSSRSQWVDRARPNHRISSPSNPLQTMQTPTPTTRRFVAHPMYWDHGSHRQARRSLSTCKVSMAPSSIPGRGRLHVSSSWLAGQSAYINARLRPLLQGEEWHPAVHPRHCPCLSPARQYHRQRHLGTQLYHPPDSRPSLHDRHVRFRREQLGDGAVPRRHQPKCIVSSDLDRTEACGRKCG